MARSLLLLVIGAIAGGGAVYLIAAPDAEQSQPNEFASRPPASATPIAVPQADTRQAELVLNDGGQLSQRIAIYAQAANTADAFDLESVIQAAAAEPVSLARDLELEVLLARLAEIDPGRAVRFAQSIYLEARFVIPLFESWARSDADAAIAELATVIAPATRRKFALALLNAVGYDEQAVSLVAAALPEPERLSFRVDALVARADTDPSGALRAALELPSLSMQQQALSGIARAAAGFNPRNAVALAALIDDPRLRDNYANQVIQAWADFDPEAVFAYIESAGFDYRDMATGAFATLAASDPERLLSAAESFPVTMQRTAQRAVLQALAETDPAAALARLDLLPPGQDRTTALQSIATIYGRKNPDAALAWYRGLSPPSQDTLTAVLRGIAEVDFDRAIDLMLSEAPDTAAQGPSLAAFMGFTMMFSIVPQNTTDYGRLADRLVSSDVSMARNMVSSLMSRWSSSDSEAALSWALANADRVDSSVFRSLASQAAQQNPDLAIQALDRLPANQRQGWIEGVSQVLARSDVERAISFLVPYRGQPAYDSAMMNVVNQVAQSDPQQAARLVENAGASPRMMSAASMVAMRWAQQDPRAAVDWVMSLTEPRMQTQSLQMVATTWSQSDPNAARNWMLGMQSGASRDSAIDGYVSAMAQSGSFDTRLLDAYSSDSARQQGIRNAILQIGRNDLDEARRLLNQYIVDPEIREQTEDLLARTGGAGNGGLIFNGGLLFTN
jgi:hypothetical protein